MIVSEPIGIHTFRAASILKRLALLPRSLHLIFARSGQILPSGARFAYIGEGESFSYFKELLATSEFELVSEKFPIARIGKAIREIPASGALLCLEINRLLLPFLPEKGILTFPWLRQRIYLDSAEYRERRRKIEDNYGRKVRKHHYRFRLVHDAGSVVHFYEFLYLPHVVARFGNACHARTLAELQKVVKSGFVLQVLRDNRWIAGVVCSVWKHEVSAIAFGHLPEEEYSLRLGGMSAVYYGLIEYARKNSFACVDLIRSRPNSRDGVYCHKHRWGAVAAKDDWPHTAIQLFPPKDLPVPAPFESLLIWDGQTFREMGNA
jgi:hypothetical protein